MQAQAPDAQQASIHALLPAEMATRTFARSLYFNFLSAFLTPTRLLL
jgi:hypothetical protein